MIEFSAKKAEISQKKRLACEIHAHRDLRWMVYVTGEC